MKWLSRSLVFLLIALVFVGGFWGLNQLGALNSFSMQSAGPGIERQLPSATSTAFAMNPVRPEHHESASLTGVAKDLGIVALAWLALSALEATQRRFWRRGVRVS